MQIGFYLETREIATILFGATAVESMRFDLQGKQTFLPTNSVAIKVKKILDKGLKKEIEEHFSSAFIYSDQQRRDICESPEWTAPSNEDEGWEYAPELQ